MKFAHFSHIWAKPGMTPHQRYEELWRELQLCDELGFDYGFCVEHHFRPDESWMSSPSLYAVGAGARTRRLRVGPMGYIVPLYHPLRLAEEIAIVDQMLGGRMELGLVPGINADYFRPFGLDYDLRKSPTLEFVDYMRAAFGETQPFSFHGNEFHTDHAELSVQPFQRPHPPLWMMSRDPQTLEFCARNAISPGYFLIYPRSDAAPRYRKFLEDWNKVGWLQRPNIAYCTIVHVDETDEKAIKAGLFRASRAYEGFLPQPQPGETFDERVRTHAKKFIGRGEPATLVELGECIETLIQSIPQGDPAGGYSTALTMDVGSLQPSRGALEAACRWLRTAAMFRPKISEVLAAVREAGIMYETALRAIDQLPGQIARAEHAGNPGGSARTE
jgi:alkanesulfonate monooxygenase SsuD/methylene tetrahydromethanopterin reductase-like flavin-dependent oxidoreductase (luciferase family)